MVESCLDLRWNMDPVAATAAGITDYDGRLGVYARDTVRQYVAALKSSAGSLEWCSPPELEDEIDRTALLDDTRVAIHRFEREQPHVRNPTFWLSHMFEGLYLLLALRDRSREHRATAAAGRVQAVPGFLEDAKATLHDCPRIFAEAAIDMGRSGETLLDRVESQLGPSAPGNLAEDCAKAREALRDFVKFLEDEFLENENTGFAIGEDWFDFRLHYEHALRNSAPELWRFGRELVERVERELTAMARKIEPGTSWADLADRLRADHPSADNLVAAYAEEMERAHKFVEERGLVPMLEGGLEVIETPEFLRPLTPFAAYQPPGPFSSDRTGWFYVTPPDPGSDAATIDRLLKDHCSHDIPSTALHEGYPGHHLQFLHTLEQPRPVRKVVGSALTIEGWALYCEEMMGEEGFYTDPAQLFFQKIGLLWRATRVVLDVGLHTRGMSVEEAIAHLADKLHFDRTHAEAEVRRYCGSPCYQLAYAVGRREFMKLRESYREAAGGEYGLRKFHELVVRYCGLPVSLIRWGMGLNE
ncbi:MAG: DUF885 domain-containing protein [Gemmatimonadales bacterium]